MSSIIHLFFTNNTLLKPPHIHSFPSLRNGMVKSWFSQMSPSLQLIHKSLVNCELAPESDDRFK